MHRISLDPTQCTTIWNPSKHSLHISKVHPPIWGVCQQIFVRNVENGTYFSNTGKIGGLNYTVQITQALFSF